MVHVCSHLVAIKRIKTDKTVKIPRERGANQLRLTWSEALLLQASRREFASGLTWLTCDSHVGQPSNVTLGERASLERLSRELWLTWPAWLGPELAIFSFHSFHMKFSFRGGRALARLARLGCAVRLLALRPPRPPCFPTGAPLALCRASGHHHYGRTGAGAPWTSELSTTTAPGCRELHAALETC